MCFIIKFIYLFIMKFFVIGFYCISRFVIFYVFVNDLINIVINKGDDKKYDINYY